MLGASSFTFAHASWTQTLPDWIDAHVRAFEAIGGVTRRQLLDEIDRPALNPLPAEPYVFSEWRVRRVGIDYHVEVAGHYYSVPSPAPRSTSG